MRFFVEHEPSASRTGAGRYADHSGAPVNTFEADVVNTSFTIRVPSGEATLERSGTPSRHQMR